jgi:hypothetical protein
MALSWEMMGLPMELMQFNTVAVAWLQFARSAPENKEWLASREKIGRQLDPEAVDITWRFAPVMDPYGICKPLPDKVNLIGREYFARSLDKEDWVSFDDLPMPTRSRLWERMRAGHFDAREVKPTLASPDMPVNFNRMLFRLESLVHIEGRVTMRCSVRPDTPLLVKPADPESMIYQLVTVSQQTGAHVIGWMPARAAKRYRSITCGSVVAHFVYPRELRDVRDLETFLRHSA